MNINAKIILGSYESWQAIIEQYGPQAKLVDVYKMLQNK